MKRQNFILFCIVMMFILIMLRLFYWQIIKRNVLIEAAQDQYYYTLILTPKRGEIHTSDGNPLVINKPGFMVYAEPHKIENKDNFAELVASKLNIDKDIIYQRISQDKIVWVPLIHKINESDMKKVADLKLQGIGFEPEGKRYYPEASMAAHLLGFVGSDVNGEDKGYFGIEGYYDRALKGKAGLLIQEKDARGLPIILNEGKRIPAEDGQNLELYLDRTVQHISETRLKEGISKYGAKAGVVVIEEVKTGGILGSSVYPNYDPSDYGSYEVSNYPNPLIAHTYEPGSTFKSLVMATALNEKVIEPETVYDENGPVQIGEYTIRTWNNEYHGKMTAIQILEKSSNPGMVFVGKKIGKSRQVEYLRKFGFGDKTDIDLEEESSGQIRRQEDWKEIDLATASFGQGIAVTPIQMIQAVGALANNGWLMKPKIVKKIIDKSGKIIEHKPERIDQVIRPAAAKLITEMMISAVDNGEAKWAKPKGYRIAGKTGTAQIPVAGHYDTEKTIASFIGYAPADDPKFVMLVTLTEPTSSPWGSETAAPLFFEIAKDLFAYYSISPTY